MLENEEFSSLVDAVLLLKFQPGNFLIINRSTSKFLLFFFNVHVHCVERTFHF